MTVRPWGRPTPDAEDGAEDVRDLVAAGLAVRFSVTAEAFAARLIELAGAAGVPAADFTKRVSLDDLYLATACAADDPRAWAECEAKHFAFIRSFAHRFLPDADARDLAAQVIAELWQRRKIARYAGRSTLRTWLGTVVSHAALNARRSATRLVPLTQISSAMDLRAASSDAASPEDASAERMLAGLLSRAIGALSAEEKLLLYLYYEQGLTLDQMEIAMRSSKATLSRRLKAIRIRLKSAVEDAAAPGTARAQIREGIKLERLDIDLSVLLRPVAAVEEPGRDGV